MIGDDDGKGSRIHANPTEKLAFASNKISVSTS